MPWSVLILPLIGGYLFVNFYVLTRYYTKTHSGQRLVFNAAAVGAALVVPARIIVEVCNRFLPTIGAHWRIWVPIDFSGTAWLALVLGGVALLVLNKLTSRDWAMRWATSRQDSNPLDRLLYQSQQRWKDLQLNVTLVSGKVYIGWLREKRLIGHDGDSAYLEIVPTVSGYRDSKTHEVTFTTNYLPVYKALPKNQPLEMVDFVKVIPLSRVETVSFFDPSVYAKFGTTPAHGTGVEVEEGTEEQKEQDR